MRMADEVQKFKEGDEEIKVTADSGAVDHVAPCMFANDACPGGPALHCS